MTQPTSLYSEAYRELNACAQRLRELPPEDIDSLVELVERATAAHKACKKRLAQVKALVAEKIETPES